MSARDGQVVGLLAEFPTPEALLRAIEALRARGYHLLEAYTPFPVEGLDEALGLRRSWLNVVNGAAGLFGAAFAFWLQWLVNHRLYPLDIGGRPSFAIPAFIVITFETMVLFAGVTAFLTVAWACRLPRLSHPVFDVEGFESATLDRFWVGVSADDAVFDADRSPGELRKLGAERVELAKERP